MNQTNYYQLKDQIDEQIKSFPQREKEDSKDDKNPDIIICLIGQLQNLLVCHNFVDVFWLCKLQKAIGEKLGFPFDNKTLLDRKLDNASQSNKSS